MRILFVTHLFPYPPNDGGHIGFFNPIKYLSRRNEVVLASMVEPHELQYVPEMRRYCASVETYVRPGWRDKLRLGRGLFRDPPGSAAKYWDAGFGRLLKECVRQYGIDLVEFQHLNMAAYRDQAGSAPAILREHNIEYKVWERYAAHARGSLESLYVRRCAPRVRAYEAKMAPTFARCITVSKADARHLTSIAPTARVESIPSGVDMEYFHPAPEIPEEPCRMVLTGSFEWKPKQHNLRVLLTEIMPRIQARLPQAKLDVVGKGVPEDLCKLAASMPAVAVTGTVPDVRPYVWRSSLVLNYLESGGGIALKVLEAMAMRKPVLSNSLGCEGIEVDHGHDVFLADGAVEFSDAVAHLLEDAATRRNLAENAYHTAEALYSWAVLANRFRDCYEAVIAERTSVKTMDAPDLQASAQAATRVN